MFWLVPRPASLKVAVTVPSEFSEALAVMKCGLTAWAGRVVPMTSSNGATMRKSSDRFMIVLPSRVDGRLGGGAALGVFCGDPGHREISPHRRYEDRVGAS